MQVPPPPPPHHTHPPRAEAGARPGARPATRGRAVLTSARPPAAPPDPRGPLGRAGVPPPHPRPLPAPPPRHPAPRSTQLTVEEPALVAAPLPRRVHHHPQTPGPPRHALVVAAQPTGRRAGRPSGRGEAAAAHKTPPLSHPPPRTRPSPAGRAPLQCRHGTARELEGARPLQRPLDDGPGARRCGAGAGGARRGGGRRRAARRGRGGRNECRPAAGGRRPDGRAACQGGAPVRRANRSPGGQPPSTRRVGGGWVSNGGGRQRQRLVAATAPRSQTRLCG